MPTTAEVGINVHASGAAEAARDLSKVEKGLYDVSKTASSAKLDGYVNSLSAVGVKVNIASRHMQGLAKAMNDVDRERVFRQLQQDAHLSTLKLARLRAEAGDIRGAFQSLGTAAANAKIAVAAVAAAALYAGKACFDAAVAQDRLAKSYEAITGSSSGAQAQLAFVLDTSRKLGLEYTSTAEAAKTFFSSASGTPLEKDMNRIFSSVSKAGTALSLSSDQMQGVFLALGQMVSKGKVQAEELRGQLGERLPGAFQLAAKAMGMTTAELDKFMADGKLTADDLLPKLADALENRFGAAAERAADGAAQSVNRISTEWELFKANVMDSDAMVFVINTVTNALRGYNGERAKAARRDNAITGMKAAGWKPSGRQEILGINVNGEFRGWSIPKYTDADVRAWDEAKAYRDEQEKTAKAWEKAVERNREETAAAMRKVESDATAAFQTATKKTMEARLSAVDTAENSAVEAQRIALERGVITQEEFEKRRLAIAKAYAGQRTSLESGKSAATENAARERGLNAWQDELAQTQAAVASLREQLAAPATASPFDADQTKILADYRKALELIGVEMDKLSRQKGIGAEQLETLRSAKNTEAELKKDLALRASNQKQRERDAERAKDRLDFYKELEEMSGQYGLALSEENALLDKQVEALGKLNIPDGYVAKWEKLKRLELSNDPLAQLTVSLQKYGVESTKFGTELGDALTSSFDSAADAFGEFCATGKLDFSSLTNSIIKDMARMAAKAALGGFANWLGNTLGNALGGGLSAGTGAVGDGGVELAAPTFIGEWHSGGMAWESPAVTRAMPVSAFDSAPRFHSGRMPWNAATELPAIIRRDESVLTPGQMRTLAGAGAETQVNVNIVNSTGEKTSTRNSSDNAGNKTIDVYVGDMAAKQMTTPGTTLSRAVTSQTGMRRPTIKR